MLNKDKLWLVVYISVKGISDYDVPVYIQEATRALTLDNDGSVEWLFIPIKEGDTRVECVYDPSHGSNEKYEEFFKKANDYIDNFLKEQK